VRFRPGSGGGSWSALLVRAISVRSCLQAWELQHVADTQIPLLWLESEIAAARIQRHLAKADFAVEVVQVHSHERNPGAQLTRNLDHPVEAWRTFHLSVQWRVMADVKRHRGEVEIEMSL